MAAPPEAIWAQLVRDSGGLPAHRLADLAGGEPGRARFVAAIVADQGLLPLVARVTPAQAIGLLLLNELDLGGHADDAGAQAAEALEALASTCTEAYLLKRGRVGGPAEAAGSREITPEQVQAVLDAIASGSVDWEQDPDFGYLVAVEVPGLEHADLGLTLPRILYRRADRAYEHAAQVAEVRARRRRALEAMPRTPSEVVEALA